MIYYEWYHDRCWRANVGIIYVFIFHVYCLIVSASRCLFTISTCPQTTIIYINLMLLILLFCMLQCDFLKTVVHARSTIVYSEYIIQGRLRHFFRRYSYEYRLCWVLSGSERSIWACSISLPLQFLRLPGAGAAVAVAAFFTEMPPLILPLFISSFEIFIQCSYFFLLIFFQNLMVFEDCFRKRLQMYSRMLYE